MTILLEELLELGEKGAEYDAWLISITKKDQFGSGFVKVNPNSKIPALLDKSANDLRVFESGSILLYLAEKFGAFLPKDPAKKVEAMNWLFWNIGAAPYVGNFGHFYVYAKEKQEYPVNRFSMETKRMLDVLDQHLEKNKFLAGEEYSIADMANYGWFGNLLNGKLYGDAFTFLSVEKYEHARRWAKEISERPAVKRGLIVNRPWGDVQLAERHDASDFETKVVKQE